MTARTGAKTIKDAAGRDLCPDCGGLIEIRNPTGSCDHLNYKPAESTPLIANPVPDRLAPRPWRP